MKKYIDAELEIVSMSNDIIATSVAVGAVYTDGNYEAETAGRRSIWN